MEAAFRQLREAWFKAQLRTDAHEREWETEDQEKRREAINREIKAIYDADTDAIVRGELRTIAPTREAELGMTDEQFDRLDRLR